MDKGSGTRSGLLWEVERLLNETPELPQILLMENVPNVHGSNNVDNFNKWKNSLEWMGYRNHVADLNAKNYGVGQSRNRCFMVSVLGNKSYEFPKPIPTDKCMKDYLEEKVDPKYYVDTDNAKETIDKMIKGGKLSDYTTGKQAILADLGVGGGSEESSTEWMESHHASQQHNIRIPSKSVKCCCLNSKGGRGGVDNIQPSVQDRVYDIEGISVAVTTSYMPKIVEVIKVE